MMRVDDGAIEAVFFQPLDHPEDERLSEERHRGLRAIVGQGPEARPEPGCEHHRLHEVELMRGSARCATSIVVLIGPSDVRAVLDGMFRLDGGAMFGIVPKPLWSKAEPADEENRVPLALRCLLIRVDDRVI